MLAANPLLLNAPYNWSETDRETAIQAAAQVGSASVAEFLLEKGASLDTCTAAMLGRVDEVEQRINADPKAANEAGAHGIPLLPHAVWSGNLELVRWVYEHGATSGTDSALHNAVLRGNYNVVRWLVENARPDVNAENYQGKTPLVVAEERKDKRIVELLKQHGATE